MELNITKFFHEAAPMDYSASVAEIGADAGRATWQAACDDAKDFPLLTTDEQREAFRAHVKGFGAWSADEIGAWSDTELNALCIQMIAGDIRETGMNTDVFDWQEYEAQAHAGMIAGRMFRGDDGEVYFYIGD